MTVLGKILAIANLLFSVVVAALVIVVYVTRTNWHEGYVKLEDQLKVADANAQAYREEALAAPRKYEERVKGIEKQLNETIALLDSEKRAHAAVRQQLVDEKKKGMGESANVTALQGDANKSRNEVKGLETALKQRDDRILEMVKATNKMRDEKVAAELEAGSLRDRNSRIVAQMEELMKENSSLRKNGGTTLARMGSVRSRENPPPEDIRGLVTEADPRSGMVTLSIGSDAGLTRGHTLDVFRLSPKGEYLGQIRIINVRANEAVGQPITHFRKRIQAGDQVGVIGVAGSGLGS